LHNWVLLKEKEKERRSNAEILKRIAERTLLAITREDAVNATRKIKILLAFIFYFFS